MILFRPALISAAVVMASAIPALADSSMMSTAMSPVIVECTPVTSLFQSPSSTSTQFPVTTAVMARYANMSKVTATSVDLIVKIGGRAPVVRHYTTPIAPDSMGSRTVELTTPIPGDDPIVCHVTAVHFSDGTTYTAK